MSNNRTQQGSGLPPPGPMPPPPERSKSVPMAASTSSASSGVFFAGARDFTIHDSKFNHAGQDMHHTVRNDNTRWSNFDNTRRSTYQNANNRSEGHYDTYNDRRDFQANQYNASSSYMGYNGPPPTRGRRRTTAPRGRSYGNRGSEIYGSPSNSQYFDPSYGRSSGPPMAQTEMPRRGSAGKRSTFDETYFGEDDVEAEPEEYHRPESGPEYVRPMGYNHEEEDEQEWQRNVRAKPPNQRRGSTNPFMHPPPEIRVSSAPRSQASTSASSADTYLDASDEIEGET